MPDIEDSGATASLLPVAPSTDGVSGAKSAAWDMGAVFPGVLGAALVALIAAFTVFAKYGEVDTEEYYMFYIHVAIMIFVGFGFLMTFLRRYSLGAVSLNFVTSCMMMLFAVLLVRSHAPPHLLSEPGGIYSRLLSFFRLFSWRRWGLSSALVPGWRLD